MIFKDNEKKLYLLIYIEKRRWKKHLHNINHQRIKGSWDVFLFNTEMTIKRAVLTEKPYKLRETRDEWRGTNDERRMTRGGSDK